MTGRSTPISAEARLVAACGLYCGACRSFLAKRCPGCVDNHKAHWCGVRSCAHERGFASCAMCSDHPTPGATCKRFRHPIGRLFGLLFNSDRAACIAAIRERGHTAFAAEMAADGRQTLPLFGKRRARKSS